MRKSSTSLLSLILVFLFSGTGMADLYDDELPEDKKKPDEPTKIVPVAPDTPAKPVTKPEDPKDSIGGKKKDEKKGQNKVKQTVLAPSTPKTARKEKEKKEPVKYQSKGLNGLRTKGRIELLEDVLVSQGSLKLEANSAKIDFDNETNEVDRVIAEGQIKMFRYDEDSGEQIKAFGDKMTFLNNERKVILEGNARLYRGPNLLRGHRLIYELDTGWIRAEKVEGELHPDTEEK